MGKDGKKKKSVETREKGSERGEMSSLSLMQSHLGLFG